MANKAYKFRIYPTDVQAELLNKTFGCVRFVYNKMLAERNETYEQYKSDQKILRKQKFPTPARYKTEFAWLNEVDSLALANAQINLQRAYANFFAGRGKFPKFKSKKAKQSYTTNMVNENIRLLPGCIKLPKLTPFQLKQHRQIPAHHKIKSCTISRSAAGKYHISILTEYESKPAAKEIKDTIGLDFAMNGLYVESEQGKRANYPHYYRQAEEKLAKAQSVLSRRVKGSARWEKQRIKVARLHEQVANQRKDFLHKESYKLTREYDCVCIEDLNMQDMSKSKRYSKSISDNGWGMFRAFLQYKLEERGKKLIKLSKWFPSSKTCSACGTVKQTLHLSERVFRCDCGCVMDRDWNAAINIKNEGLHMLALS